MVQHRTVDHNGIHPPCQQLLDVHRVGTDGFDLEFAPARHGGGYGPHRGAADAQKVEMLVHVR